MAITAAELKVRFSTDGVGKTKQDIAGLGQTVDSVDGKSQGFLKTAAATTLGFLGGNLITGGIGALKGLAGGFIMANANAEAYRNQLEIATGSSQKAGEILTWLKKMAADTPFEFPELINAATQLESLGQSSQKWLPIIGDTAAATGKSVDQVTQAVLDAQTGEFERLKELGIRTKVEGDKVKFSFMKNGQEMVVEADNTAEGISNALMGIWSDKYSGGMDKMAQTFLGKLSTLKDNVNLIAQGVSKPLFDLASKGLTLANSFISNFTDMLGKGLPAIEAFRYAARQAIMDAFGPEAAASATKFIDGIVKAFEIGKSLMAGFFDLMKGDWRSAILNFADALDGIWGGITGLASSLAGLTIDLVGWVINVGAPAVVGWLADHAGDILAGVIAITGWAWNGLVDLVGWTINVAAPAIVSAGWTLLGKLNEWLFGTGASDGTGGQGYPSGGIVAKLASWTLNVAAPTIGSLLWDAAELILPAMGQVIVDLSQWTLEVGAPHVVIAGWDVVALILQAINQQILVPIDNWIVSLTAPEVVLAFGSLAQIIADKVTLENAITVAVGLTVAPYVVGMAIASFPAMVVDYVLDQIPDSVDAAVGASIAITSAIITDSVNLGFEIFKFVGGILLQATGISTGISIAITAVTWVGDIAKSLFGGGMGLVGSITAKFPDWKWPSLPSWTWPPIPTPGWVSDLIAALGGGQNGGKSGSGSGQTDSGGAAGSAGGGGGAAGAPVQPFTPRGVFGMDRPTTQYTVTINAQDNASGIIASLKANLLSIPPEKLTQLQQVGGEVVAGMSALVGAAIGTIPTSHLTALQQAGGEVVTGVAGIARAAVNAIPTAHLTAILQAGGEGVTAISNAAANAIRNIPTSHSTSISESGAAGVASAANAAAAAINAIPSVKSVAISVVVSGISAAQAAIAGVTGNGKWTGGFTDTPLTWLAENGRELVQTPTGDWFMALRKSLFAVPLGSRVYSNPETERMMASMLPVPGYAAGGVVGGGGSSSLPSLGGGSRGSLTYTDQRQYHITLSLQDTEELLRARQFFDNLEREAELAFGGGPF